MVKKIYLIVGARPNFVKIAPIVFEFNKRKIEFKLIHTGQHYDYNMSKIFFKDLGIPPPDIYLNVGSASHAVQTAKIMINFEKVLLKEKPALIIVVGDVNSTLACALVAKKLYFKVAHVEAGLRSFDMRMPEEINRRLTDQISDLLFITEKSGEFNLKKEGIDPMKLYFVGNIMIDTLIMNLDKAKRTNFYRKLNLEKNNYSLITLHRPANVDDKENLLRIIDFLNYIQDKIKIFFPIHPRTEKCLKQFNLLDKIHQDNIILSKPIGYLEFLNLILNSKFIITDSGGIQEEASFLKIPVLTLRKNTERPITIEKGTNTIIGDDFNKLKICVEKILSNSYKKGHNIEKWDGKTAIRIVDIIQKNYLNPNFIE